MKIEKTKKIIKYNIIIATILCLMIGILVFMYFHINSSFLVQYEKILSDIADIKNKTQELETKSQENKKYMQLWSRISEKRKSFTGIKVDEINKLVTNLAEKYSISNPVVKVNIPENFSPSIFQNETLSILYTIAEINFSSYHDIKAIQFANEFIENLHGYPIITKFEFAKESDYNIKDYFDISSGRSAGKIKAKLIFSWYVYKDGSPNQNQTTNPPKNENLENNEIN